MIERIATHLPVLELMKRVSNIRKILELGSGEYSTRKFLEFPNLETLYSYEDNEEWFNIMKRVKDKKLIMMLEKDLSQIILGTIYLKMILYIQLE